MINLNIFLLDHHESGVDAFHFIDKLFLCNGLSFWLQQYVWVGEERL